MKVLRSEAEFTKLTVQSTWYLPVAERTVVALSGRAGMAWPHGDTLEIPCTSGSTWRNNTVRVSPRTRWALQPRRLGRSGAHGRRQHGPVQCRVRLHSSKGIGFVIFTDAGNVWVDQAIRINDLRASYGAGFRYHTPVGPSGSTTVRRSTDSPGRARRAPFQHRPGVLKAGTQMLFDRMTG